MGTAIATIIQASLKPDRRIRSNIYMGKQYLSREVKM